MIAVGLMAVVVAVDLQIGVVRREPAPLAQPTAHRSSPSQHHDADSVKSGGILFRRCRGSFVFSCTKKYTRYWGGEGGVPKLTAATIASSLARTRTLHSRGLLKLLCEHSAVSLTSLTPVPGSSQALSCTLPQPIIDFLFPNWPLAPSLSALYLLLSTRQVGCSLTDCRWDCGRGGGGRGRGGSGVTQ